MEQNAVYQDGFRHWFNQEEIKDINANNEQYQLKSPEEELLLTWFEPATKETANKFYNTSQIAVRLAELGNLHVTDGTVNKIGKALKKHGFHRYSKNHAYVYPVKEFDFDEVDKRNRSMETTDKQEFTTQKIPYRFEN